MRNVAGSLDHHLGARCLTACGQFTQHVEFGKLGGVGRVGDATRTHSVAQRPGHVVLSHDVAKIIERFVQRVLLVVHHHPFGDQRSAAADDAGDAIDAQVQVLEFDAGVDRHVVDTLLGLVFAHVQEVLGRHVFDVATELFQHLVDRARFRLERGFLDDFVVGCCRCLCRSTNP